MGTRKHNKNKKPNKILKKTKRTKKKFRQTRSKRQNGGESDWTEQEEKDFYLFKALNVYHISTSNNPKGDININNVEQALENGADINARDKMDSELTPLIYATLDQNIILMKMLLRKGADVNMKSHSSEEGSGTTEGSGATALIYAIVSRNIEAVNLLLEHGADINIKTDTGKTALMYANSHDNLEIVYILLKHYAFLSGDTVNEENFYENCIDIDKEITYEDMIEGETTKNIREYLQESKDNIVLVYKSNKKDVDLDYFITTRTIITNVYNDKVNKFYGCDNEQGKFGESSYINNITYLKLNKIGLMGTTYEYCHIAPLLENKKHQLFAITSLNIKYPSFVSHNVLYNSDVEEAMVSGSHCQGGDAAHVSRLIKVKPCNRNIGVKRKR